MSYKTYKEFQKHITKPKVRVNENHSARVTFKGVDVTPVQCVKMEESRGHTCVLNVVASGSGKIVVPTPNHQNLIAFSAIAFQSGSANTSSYVDVSGSVENGDATFTISDPMALIIHVQYSNVIPVNQTRFEPKIK